MSRNPSLAGRLTLYLLGVFLFGTVAFWIAYISASLAGVAGDTSLELLDFAELPARRLVLESVTKTADGSLRIAPTPALRAQLSQTPTLQYAVYADGKAITGSSPELIAAFVGFDLTRVEPMLGSMVVHSADKPALAPCHLAVDDDFLVALCGYQFEPRNLVSLFWDRAQKELFKWSAPVFALAALVLWFAIRQGLAPLNAAARRVAAIDIDSLSQRAPIDDVPREIVPFVDALNGALDRLDAGVARQRRFIANAAHELRTPITALRARIDNPDDATLRHDLRRYARRLKALSEQLLVSARLAERRDAPMQEIDLAELALNQIADYLPMIRESGRDIDIEGPLSGVMVRGDRAALESILTNLIDNALRAEPAGGTVIVRTRADATIAVLDHGAGVAESDRELIFEAFWRKDQGPPGSGLGLAITKELVTRLGGKISVTDTPGGGATFYVAFLR